jgi:multidrug resistance efflux pump
MWMKKILILIALAFLLCSCYGEKLENKTEIEKQDFFIETQTISSFSWSYEIKKTWKIKSNQDILLVSKASGRVQSISTNFWANVYVWNNLINLDDNVSNYGLNLEKNNLSIENSKLNYEQNKISLDKQVSDSKIALSRQEQDYEILKERLKEDISLAKINLDNSLSSNNSLKSFTSKAELDYNNLLNSNLEKIKSFEESSRNDYLVIKNILVDIIDFSDWILGVTTLNKNRNDSFEKYLWVKDTRLLRNTKNDLLELIYLKKDKFDPVEGDDLDISNLDTFFNIWAESYPEAIAFLNNLEKVLDNSIENISFSRTSIDSYKSQINTYQSTLQSKYSSFLSFKSSAREFLNTYKSSEEVLKRSLELSASSAKVNYNKILLDSKKSLNNSSLSLQVANLNLENAIKTRVVRLKQFKNSIEVAKNSKSLAAKEYSKLFIYSPIRWVVSDILIDVWQDVSPWTPLIKISGVGKNEIEVWFSFSEIDFIKPAMDVRVDYLWNSLTWYVSSLSKVADENLNYKAIININGKINISWNIVDVFIPINLDKKLIPLGNLKVKQGKLWEISVLGPYSTSELWEEIPTIEKIEVIFWKFYWENVEIVWCVDLDTKSCDDLEIITSDTSKFDLNKFNIKIKNKDD